MTPEERDTYVQSMIAEHPDLFPEERRALVMNGTVVLGMTPDEAHMAAGAFAYKVVADKARWPEHSDPLQVIWAQSTQPDDSEIWMMFKNATQFPGEGEQPFRVVFQRGRAVGIQKLG